MYEVCMYIRTKKFCFYSTMRCGLLSLSLRVCTKLYVVERSQSNRRTKTTPPAAIVRIVLECNATLRLCRELRTVSTTRATVVSTYVQYVVWIVNMVRNHHFDPFAPLLSTSRVVVQSGPSQSQRVVRTIPEAYKCWTCHLRKKCTSKIPHR